MRKIRELLRLCVEQEISARQDAKIVGIGKTAASQYVSGFKASGFTLASLEAISDTELLAVLNLKRESENNRYNTLCRLLPQFEKELKRTGVTLQLRFQAIAEVWIAFRYLMSCRRCLVYLLLQTSFLPGNRQSRTNREWQRMGITNAYQIPPFRKIGTGFYKRGVVRFDKAYSGITRIWP